MLEIHELPENPKVRPEPLIEKTSYKRSRVGGEEGRGCWCWCWCWWFNPSTQEPERGELCEFCLQSESPGQSGCSTEK